MNIRCLLICVPSMRDAMPEAVIELGRTGSPVHAFSRPIISRTTENLSRVLRHQWSASNGSSKAGADNGLILPYGKAKISSQFL